LKKVPRRANIETGKNKYKNLKLPTKKTKSSTFTMFEVEHLGVTEAFGTRNKPKRTFEIYTSQ